MNIRTLRADEIECRVQQVKSNGCSLLLYKDARCDMRILDEVFGIDGWEREHQLIDNKLFCTVKVWSDKRNCWISKQDVGTESNTEKEKGQASDAFKRACFNIGIGRELYSAPFIWIKLNADEVKQEGSKCKLNFGVEFHIKEISYSENREINRLVIADKKGNIRFKLGDKPKFDDAPKIDNVYKVDDTPKTLNIENKWTNKLTDAQINRLYAKAYHKGILRDKVKEQVKKRFNKEIKDLTKEEYDTVCEGYDKLKAKVS